MAMGMKGLLLRMRQMKESQVSTESTTTSENTKTKSQEDEQVNQSSEEKRQPETKSWVVKKNNAFWKALAVSSFKSKIKPKAENKAKSEQTIVKTKMALKPVSGGKVTIFKSKRGSIDNGDTRNEEKGKKEEIVIAGEKEVFENKEKKWKSEKEGEGDKEEEIDQGQCHNIAEEKNEDKASDEGEDDSMAEKGLEEDEDGKSGLNDEAVEVNEVECPIEKTVKKIGAIEEVKFDVASIEEPNYGENDVGRETASEYSEDQLNIDVKQNLLTLSMINAEYRDIPDIVKFQWHHDGTLTDIDRDFIRKGRTFHARKARRHRLRRWQEDMAQCELIAVLEAMCNNYKLMDEKLKSFMRSHGVVVPSDKPGYYWNM